MAMAIMQDRTIIVDKTQEATSVMIMASLVMG